MPDPADGCPVTMDALQSALDDTRRLLRGCEARYFALVEERKKIKRWLAQNLTRKVFYEVKEELGL